MRQCPTLAGDDRPLIAHSIANTLCSKRQREFYHKCHRCVFRGKPADYEVAAPGAPEDPAVARRVDGKQVAPLLIEVSPGTSAER